MRITDNATPPAKVICTKDLVINPILTAQNPWRTPAVRITPVDLEYASIDRDHFENNLCVKGSDVYVTYYGSVGGVEDLWIQRSKNGGVTFSTPQRFNVKMDCNSWTPHEICRNGYSRKRMGSCLHIRLSSRTPA